MKLTHYISVIFVFASKLLNYFARVTILCAEHWHFAGDVLERILCQGAADSRDNYLQVKAGRPLSNDHTVLTMQFDTVSEF